MGMYDESWCADCGKSQPYSKDDVICGECATESADMRSNQLINYMKLHLISLEQDSEKIQEQMNLIDDLESDEMRFLEIEDISTNGQIFATRHLLSVAADIMGIQLEEK